MAIEADNLDADEVDKFTRLAQQWWDENGDFKALHDINPARVNYITGRLAVAQHSVLDVGCGGGILTEALARAGARMSAIDAGRSAIAVAQQHAEGQNLDINYQCLTAEALLRAGSERFDAITCMELLEHVPDPPRLLHTLAGLLRPEGYIVLATINRSLPAYLGAVLTAEYLLRLLPQGTHDYGKFIRPAELCRWLRTAGFTVLDIAGLHYLPGLRYCTVSARPGINYMVHARLGA